MASHSRNLNVVRMQPPKFSRLEIVGFGILAMQVIQVAIFCYMVVKGH